MGDLLKAKIQQRPDRQELVRQHILEGNNGASACTRTRLRILAARRYVGGRREVIKHEYRRV
jgi:hypothetical protein